MKKNELFLKRIKTELLSELEQISRLMDAYTLRVKTSFMANFLYGHREGLKVYSRRNKRWYTKGRGLA